MKVGLIMYQGDFLMGGFFRAAYNLIRELIRLDTQNTYQCIHGLRKPENFRGLEAHEIILPMKNWQKMRKLPSYLAKMGFDIILDTANISPLFFREPYKKIVTIHDLTPLRNKNWVTKRSHLVYRFYLPIALRTVDLILVPSLNTKQDLQSYYGIPDSKIKVIHWGIEEKFFQPISGEILTSFRNQKGLNFPYILHVGNLNPHKNLITALKAYTRLPPAIKKEYRFVSVGPKGDLGDYTIKEILKLNLGDSLVRLEYVDDEELVMLYRGAALFLFPSLYEGFGFPVLEGMASGTSVICSNTASLPELVGEGGILLSPLDVDSWREAIIRVLSEQNLQNSLREKGKIQSKKFSWRKCALEHLKIYENIRGIKK